MHFLKAVEAVRTDDAEKVVARMKSTPIDDFYAKGTIRPDGRAVHDMFLLQVKTPKESTEPWDYFKVVEKIPGDQAFTKLADSKCALLKK
jgi:branched-chain amino acid transport system substrate-binding protein